MCLSPAACACSIRVIKEVSRLQEFKNKIAHVVPGLAAHPLILCLKHLVHERGPNGPTTPAAGANEQDNLSKPHVYRDRVLFSVQGTPVWLD